MLTHYFPFGMERYFIGGLFIGLGVALLYVMTGRLGGASTIFSSTWSWFSKIGFFQQNSFLQSRNWRLIYAAGMLIGGIIYVAFGLPTEATQVSIWRFIVGGVLIGFGSRLGGGCTSGHGICGMASLSVGSMVMVAIFLSTAIITALLMSGLGVTP